MRSLLILLLAAFGLAGCVGTEYVGAGNEGKIGNNTSLDDVEARRKAVKAVKILKSEPGDNYTYMADITVRRCHRDRRESPPSEASLTNDLVLETYARGGDAIHEFGSKKMNGLAANCWYVIEATASIYNKN